MNSRCTFIVALCSASSALAQPSSFQGIGVLSSDQPASGASAVSADGRTVVGSVFKDGAFRAARWSADSGLQALDTPAWSQPTWNWHATAVSQNGEVIAGSVEAGLSGWLGLDHAFRWTGATGIQQLKPLPGHATAGAMGMSDDGSVVVGLSSGSGSGSPVRWTASGEADAFLGLAPGWATAASFDGSAITGNVGAKGFHWSAAAGLILLSQNPELWPSDITADGTTIIGRGSNTGLPFRWVNGAFVAGPSPLPGASFHAPIAVSDDGSVVVSNHDDYLPTSRPQASIWNPALGTRSLELALATEYGVQLSGWELHSVGGISADGRVIVGTGKHPCGHTEGWIVRLGTLPSCYADCDLSSGLNIADFACFLDRFAAGNAYANCDSSCIAPALNVADFSCFLQKFAAGCP